MLDELKRLYDASPFHPFEIELDDAAIIPVDLPEFVGWSEDAGLLMYADGAESISTLPLSRVRAVRVMDKPRVRWAR